ncbi:MAG: hypothetical protein KDD47_26710 [Acidobacteria bacterium]|nr:hypothetical protein [Acidobacteriota bacterium]
MMRFRTLSLLAVLFLCAGFLTGTAAAEETAAPEAEAATAVVTSPTTATCIASLIQQANLSEEPMLSQEPPAFEGDPAAADLELLIVPTNPCFRAPAPPSSCVCGGCCENCRCWHNGSIAKCLPNE